MKMIRALEQSTLQDSCYVKKKNEQLARNSCNTHWTETNIYMVHVLHPYATALTRSSPDFSHLSTFSQISRAEPRTHTIYIFTLKSQKNTEEKTRERGQKRDETKRKEKKEMGMGREEAREAEKEGVMATDFFWSYTDEPHATRRRQILSQYPQLKELFGPDPWALPKVTLVVLLQLGTATLLHDAGWLKILVIAYFFGSFLNHNLFLAIHELSHNLAFSTPVYNRWLGMFANLPIGVPMSVTFQKYHLEHHRFQGVDGIDMDIPSLTETRLVTNVVAKSIWVILQLFFYAFRPLFLKPKPPGCWEFINFTIQISLDVAVVYFWGWKSFAYLILSTFVGGGMHPMAGHFISEHYIFNPDQETYSYYGPLNLLTWHVGYHNEHHDFPRIPGNKLHKVRELAPEYYEDLASYKSWSQVIYMYIMDRTVGPFSRMKRKVSATKKSE